MMQKVDWTDIILRGLLGLMIILIIAVVILIVSVLTSHFDTDTQNAQTISIWYVVEKDVTCFIWRGESFNGGVHCIPDWQLSPPSN